MAKNQKVVVAMSGGVDSSAAACLLVKANYEVIGISLNFFALNQNKFGSGQTLNQSNLGSGFDYEIDNERICCSLKAIESARGVAQKIGIPFYVLDYKKEFQENVVKYFCAEYKEGRTPNPCVICNQEIKFGELLKKAKTLGANYLATGHYVKIEYNSSLKRYILRKGKDRKRDQSYFLFSLSQEQLKHTLFPLGDYTKDEVRKLAKKLGLKVHDKPASQDVCFIPDSDPHEFLRKCLNDECKAGLMVNNKGEVVGRHGGIAFYTVGQRKGLGCHRKPMYVTGIDKKKNVVVIGGEKELYQDLLIAEDVNWVDRVSLTGPLKVKARIRYRNKESEAVVSPLNKSSVKVKFSKPQRAITPGQAVVFYDRDKIVGGGWIL